MKILIDLVIVYGIAFVVASPIAIYLEIDYRKFMKELRRNKL